MEAAAAVGDMEAVARLLWRCACLLVHAGVTTEAGRALQQRIATRALLLGCQQLQSARLLVLEIGDVCSSCQPANERGGKRSARTGTSALLARVHSSAVLPNQHSLTSSNNMLG